MPFLSYLVGLCLLLSLVAAVPCDTYYSNGRYRCRPRMETWLRVVIGIVCAAVFIGLCATIFFIRRKRLNRKTYQDASLQGPNVINVVPSANITSYNNNHVPLNAISTPDQAYPNYNDYHNHPPPPQYTPQQTGVHAPPTQ